MAQPDGVKIGWWDLTTDEAHPDSPQFLPALVAAVARWKAARPPGGLTAVAPLDAVPGAASVADRPLTPAHPVPPPAPPALSAPDGAHVVPALAGNPWPAEDMPATGAAQPAIHTSEHSTAGPGARPWIDLAAHTPGAQAREQARTAREAAPVKTVVARLLGVHTEERAWRIGADGEVKVAAQFAKVVARDPRWRVLHAIPVGERGADIDHLVIGPGGIFTVNAKHHPGARIWVGGNTVLVNGHRQPYVRNSRHEAARAARLLTAVCGLPVPVEALVVTVRAEDVVLKQQPEGVSVVPRHQIARWLLRHRDIHTPEVLEAVYEAARRSTTWR
ncbi:nuclease-related domain-containing protein [Kocuria dechangensis]|uniref:nuclease-related domain-containing protein n=1 Tax=Kocuria dechangensis TaxID=1176249 RepID=UPI001E4BE83F|nr:nuclease-related domain-containing protein [Kocuria dechangensis]